MSEDNRKEIKIEGETRSKSISKMIDEGGIGAEKYYDIKKDKSTEHKVADEKSK